MALLNTATLTSKFNNTEGDEISVTNKSNILQTNNLTTDIHINKTASKTWALPLDVLTVTTTITNNTDLKISGITIHDTLGDSADFVSGSVKIGEVPHTDYDPIAGFTAPVDIDGSGASVAISYQIKVSQYPIDDSITNQTTLGISMDSKAFNLTSNTLSIDILDNEIWVSKTANTTAVIAGDELTYTITIQNGGSFKNTNLQFSDPIPDGTTFVDGSVTIDDTPQPTFNPATGFPLADLDINTEITITFKVRIN